MISATSVVRDICDYKIRSHYHCSLEQCFLNWGTGNSRTSGEDSSGVPNEMKINLKLHTSLDNERMCWNARFNRRFHFVVKACKLTNLLSNGSSK